jgi:hypothetical protein
MKTIFCFFAARRYWSDETELKEVYGTLREELGEGADCRLIIEPGDLECVEPGQVLAAVPMSGAVQSMILTAAEKSMFTVLLAGYVNGFFSPRCAEKMLAHNAAPTVMDCWAVLRRSGRALLAASRKDLEQSLRAAEACAFLRGAKLLMVGEPEPWVISVSRDAADYTRLLGVTVEQVAQRELEELYRATSDQRAEAFINPVRAGAEAIREPSSADLLEAGRMGAALEELLERYRADGAAVACFSLLATSTTTCLGVSRLNDSADRIAACEGDLDSACTMLLMKKLAKTRLWMANPSLQSDGTVSFSHCYRAPARLRRAVSLHPAQPPRERHRRQPPGGAAHGGAAYRLPFLRSGGGHDRPDRRACGGLQGANLPDPAAGPLGRPGQVSPHRFGLPSGLRV